MVKGKPTTKAHAASSAKRAKNAHTNKAASTSKAATHKEERKLVDPTKLAWSTVHLPFEAQSGGAGVTESDFFDSLNWNDDDFMGLQEIDDVDVLQETRADGSRTISFLASDKKIKNKNKAAAAAATAAAASANLASTQKLAPKQKQKAKQSKKRTIEEVVSEAEPEATEEVEAGDVTAITEDAGDADSDEYETAADVTMPTANDAAAAEDSDSDLDLDDDDLAEAFRNAHQLDLQDDDEDDDGEFDQKLLPAWSHLPLHAALKRALVYKGFKKPTEIQNRSLPFALGLQQEAASSDESDDDAAAVSAASSSRRKRDVVGVSQTGSGKTLAYGLPILNYLFENAENAIASSSKRSGTDDVPPPLGALILCPTRELALQVSSHLTDLVRASCRVGDDEDAEISHKKLLRRPQIAVVCGGMSEQKQRRLLDGRSRQGDRKAGVDIIVATPGRLWEMTRLDDHLAARIKQTRFLVLDEADRMVEVGHFAEMEHILNLVNRSEAKRPSEGKDGQQHGGSDECDESESEVESHGVKPNSNMQTFIFSATLSKALQINLKRRRKPQQFTKKRHSKRKENATTLDELMDRVDFRDEAPAVIDLTPGQGLPERLMETKIECVGKDKDLYLYYFLLRYPGRSLVFVNSIDGIRRLTPILAQLNITCYPIHSQLQQKQRLKNLDRFRAFNRSGKVTNCVLLATDVAARGLDIPSVEHVVHYQLPRSADTYVHRSGRTARAGSSGISLALIEPKEKTLWAQLCKAMSRKSDVPTFPITFSTLSLLRERVELALAIDKQTHEANKQAHDDNWLAKLAEEADLAMSDEDVDPDAPTVSKSKAQKGKAAAKLNEMKAKLAGLLAKPITTKGLSHRYLTATGLQGSAWVDDMISQKSHEQILGVQNTDAQTDLQSRQQHQQPSKKKAKTDKSAATTAASDNSAKAQVRQAKKNSTAKVQKRKPKK
ncbi:related to MAK5 - ATP-dependent RNA helicase [Ustilago trichophora]|uniref:ATP-dependent RNA helicase n=1 Tax=Ustilago trichophora TaxID=86804 RepID=A0A5C3DSD1_9BASI|nr:related to MAK5 - ATP-dependent RNA helicase [Ustilago trichophora]